MQKNTSLVLLSLLILGITFTACTTTKHLLKRTQKIKVYKASEVLKSYGLDKIKDEYDIFITPVSFDADYLIGFSFEEQLQEKVKNKYPKVPISDGESPLHIEKISVNIDLCKHWKHTSFRETPLQETAYGKNYSSFNPTDYKLFMSLEKLKKKNLISDNPNDQEDICIYIDREYSGHFGRFKDKSNKIYYKANEINDARVALERVVK